MRNLYMFTFFISYLKVCTLIVSMMLSVVSLSVNVCIKTVIYGSFIHWDHAIFLFLVYVLFV